MVIESGEFSLNTARLTAMSRQRYSRAWVEMSFEFPIFRITGSTRADGQSRVTPSGLGCAGMLSCFSRDFDLRADRMRDRASLWPAMHCPRSCAIKLY